MWCYSLFYVAGKSFGNYRLTGVIPFHSEDRQLSMKYCITGNYGLENEVVFDRLGEEAKDLIQCILQIDPFVRFDFEEIKRHPWMKNL